MFHASCSSAWPLRKAARCVFHLALVFRGHEPADILVQQGFAGVAKGAAKSLVDVENVAVAVLQKDAVRAELEESAVERLLPREG